MLLNDEEKRMLDGEYGTGTQRAMSFLKTLGEALDTEKMVRVTSAHIISALAPTNGGVVSTGSRSPIRPC